MLVLSDHIHFIYVLFYLLSLFIFFIYFLDVITSNTVISRQKITISAGTPVRIFQNIWRYISAVSTVSFFLSLVIWGDIWHIFKILYLLFCSIYSRLSCTLVIFCVRHYLFLALWFWMVLNGSSVFEILFILFLRSKVSSPSASFCPWDQSSWKAAGSLTSSVGVMRGRTAHWTPACTSGWSPTPAPALRSTLRPITCVTVSVRALRPKVGQQRN